MKLSDTQMQILAAAAAHPLLLAIPPAKLPTAAREAVRKSLLAKGLIEAVEVDDSDAHETWAAEAGPVTYRLVAQEPTQAATAAVEAGEAPGGLYGAAEATPPHTAPTESLEGSLPQRRASGLRYAATAVLILLCHKFLNDSAPLSYAWGFSRTEGPDDSFILIGRQ
jgi:hypothetical protein